MGKQKWTEDRFSKCLRDERESRGWSQARLAELLSDNGTPMHHTTVAKIEKGDRSVRIDEAAAIADLFDVSLDRLLGRSAAPRADEDYTRRRLTNTVVQAAALVSGVTDSLRDGASDLAAFHPTDTAVKRLVSQSQRVADALADASASLWEALSAPEGFPAGHDVPVQAASGRVKR